MPDDIVHPAPELGDKTDTVLGIGLHPVPGLVVDDGEVRLVQRGHHGHTVIGRSAVVCVNIDRMGVAVDHKLLTPRQTGSAAAHLGKAVGVQKPGSKHLQQQVLGLGIQHLADGGVELGLPQGEIVLLGILGHPDQHIFMGVEEIGFVFVDLLQKLLAGDAVFDGVGHLLPAQADELFAQRLLAAGDGVERVGTVEVFMDDGDKAAHHQYPQPIGVTGGVLSGGKQRLQRDAGGAAGGVDVPVLVLLRVLFQLLVHPVPELLFGHDGELVQVLRPLIVGRGSARLLKTLAVEGDLPGPEHQLMDQPVLLFLGLFQILRGLFVQSCQDLQHNQVFSLAVRCVCHNVLLSLL